MNLRIDVDLGVDVDMRREVDLDVGVDFNLGNRTDMGMGLDMHMDMAFCFLSESGKASRVLVAGVFVVLAYEVAPDELISFDCLCRIFKAHPTCLSLVKFSHSSLYLIYVKNPRP